MTTDEWLAQLRIDEWRPLNATERDLLRRSLGRVTSTTETTDPDPVSDAA